MKESSKFLRFYRSTRDAFDDPSRTMEGDEMKLKNYFNFVKASLLAPGMLLLALAPGALAQAHGSAPMGGNSNSNMNNPNGNMGPDGMQPPGSIGAQSNDQIVEQNAFGNLRRNFDVENDLSKMALKNSSNDDVKKFAQQVISENHSLSNELVVPNPNGEMGMQPEMVPSETKKAEKQMKKMTGKPFDQMYLVQMDAYIKNDQEVAQKAQSATNVAKMSEVGTKVRSQSEDREKQIGTLTQETGFKIQ
jgi:predicted outer membrane protein